MALRCARRRFEVVLQYLLYVLLFFGQLAYQLCTWLIDCWSTCLIYDIFKNLNFNFNLMLANITATAIVIIVIIIILQLIAI